MTRVDGTPIRVLIVDDEDVLAEMVSLGLRAEGWRTATAASCATATEAVLALRPDAVVLDIQLPDGCGLKLLEKLRSRLPDLPVLFFTARDAPEDRVWGLRVGADDYVTKPCSIEEVVLRLRNLLRRNGTGASVSDSTITVGDLVLDEETHEVTRAGFPITLTCTEFQLLRLLMNNPRKVMSRTQILQEIWSYDFKGTSNVVGLYISYLRKKIDTGHPPMIHTYRGAGYVLKPAI
jgi:two-component system OmpR family response regulator